MAETVCTQEKMRRRIQRLSVIALIVVVATMAVLIASMLQPTNPTLERLGQGFVVMTVAIACYVMGFAHAHERYKQLDKAREGQPCQQRR